MEDWDFDLAPIRMPHFRVALYTSRLRMSQITLRETAYGDGKRDRQVQKCIEDHGSARHGERAERGDAQ